MVMLVVVVRSMFLGEIVSSLLDVFVHFSMFSLYRIENLLLSSMPSNLMVNSVLGIFGRSIIYGMPGIGSTFIGWIVFIWIVWLI